MNFVVCLLSDAIERLYAEANSAVAATIYKVGNVQLFQRNRNLLNFIIIPVSVGLTLLLVIVTFFLRRLRFVTMNHQCIELPFHLSILDIDRKKIILSLNYKKRKKQIRKKLKQLRILIHMLMRNNVYYN